MPEKILYVINHIDWFWSHRLPLAKGAQQLGLDVNLAVTGAEKDQKLRENNFKGHELPTSHQGFLPLTLIKTICTLRKIIKTQRPDIIHAITLKYAFLTGLAALCYKDVRIIHTIAGLGYLFSGEGLKPKILRFLIGPLLKLALKNKRTKIIFQNPDDQNLMIQRGFANKEQCHLIRGSGVDTNQYKTSPIQKTQTPLILMPTRLVHNKGIAIFIEAAKILYKTHPQLRFQIAGGLTQNNPLAISELEMKNMLEGSPVEWLGKVSDMPTLYQNASIICYPSYYGEGVPKVLLEACASARPIVTTDHPGCREAVKDGYNGLLVPVKNATETANALKTLLSSEQELDKMGKNSRLRAEKEFDVKIIVDKTLKLYRV